MGMVVAGKQNVPVFSVWDLPDTREPNPWIYYNSDTSEFDLNIDTYGYASSESFYTGQWLVRSVLENLDRGNRETGQKRDNFGSRQATMSWMNNGYIQYLSQLGPSEYLTEKTNQLQNENITAIDLLNTMARDIWYREMTDSERQVLLVQLQTDSILEGIKNIIWVMMNHPDFLYK